MPVTILRGDVRDRLRDIPDESINCVVTSPPYFGLRDYGVEGQIGLEDSPQAFVATMVAVFGEVRRVLRADGTCWLNIGDSYAGSWGAQSRPQGATGEMANRSVISARQINAHPRFEGKTGTVGKEWGLKPKDMMLVPFRLALALQADGWWVRQDIIWHKPNPMPESVRDRCTKAHEYIFLLAKSERYYYDQEAITEDAGGTMRPNHDGVRDKQALVPGSGPQARRCGGDGESRNKRSVWTVTTQAFSEAHFATFPPALIEPCILAGCPETCCAACGAPWVRDTERESIALRPNSDSIRGNSPSAHRAAGAQPQQGARAVRVTTLGWSPSCGCDAGTVAGTVLDPFFGAGTTGLVADRLQRNCIGIELNPAYADMAEKRIRGDAPLFAQVGT